MTFSARSFTNVELGSQEAVIEPIDAFEFLGDLFLDRNQVEELALRVRNHLEVDVESSEASPLIDHALSCIKAVAPVQAFAVLGVPFRDERQAHHVCKTYNDQLASAKEIVRTLIEMEYQSEAQPKMVYDQAHKMLSEALDTHFGEGIRASFENSPTSQIVREGLLHHGSPLLPVLDQFQAWATPATGKQQ